MFSFSPLRVFSTLCLLGAGTQSPAWAQALNFTGTSFSQNLGLQRHYLTPTGGTAPYTFSFAPGATPFAGYRILNRPNVMFDVPLAVTGVLLGVGVTPGTFTSTVRVTDSVGAVIDKSVTLTVRSLDMMPDFFGNRHGVGDAISRQLLGTGGSGGGYIFAVNSGSTLPPGLSLSPVGLLSGTFTTAGTFSFTLKVTDSASTTNTRGYSIFVTPMRITNVPNRTFQAVQNQASSQAINVTGGTPPYNFALTAGNALPSGLSLSSTGVISGTPPNINYSWGFSVTITDSAATPNSADIRFAIHVIPAQNPPPLTFTLATRHNDVTVGQAGVESYYVSGGLPPYSFDLAPGSTLPDNMTIINGPQRSPDSDPQPAYLQLRPSTPGTFTYSLRVTDAAGNFAIRPTIVRVSRIGFWYRNPFRLNGTPEVLGNALSLPTFPAGGSGAYLVDQVNFPAGLAIDSNGLVTGTLQDCGPINFPIYRRLRAGADELTFSDLVTNQADLSCGTSTSLTGTGGVQNPIGTGSGFTFSFSGNGSPLATPGYTFTLISGTVPPGMVLLGPNSINSTDPAIVQQISGFPTTPGTYSLTYRITDANGNIGQRVFTLPVSKMALVNTGVSPGYVGVPYNQTFDLRGATGAVTYELLSDNLPAGLSFNTSTGQITGTPTSQASLTLTLRIMDSTGDQLVRGYFLSLYPLDMNPSNGSALPLFEIGVPYSLAFTLSGVCPGCTWSATGLPAGLTLNSSNGLLSGTPTQLGVFAPVITASNGSLTSVKTYSLYGTQAQNVKLISLSANIFPLADLVPGQVIGNFVGFSGGTPPYIAAIVGGALPPGIALSAGNFPSGNPGLTSRYTFAGLTNTSGTYNFRLRVTDTAGLVYERDFRIVVAAPVLLNSTVRSALVNQPLNFQLVTINGAGATYQIADQAFNALPPGITLASNGLISGIPTATGTFSTTVFYTVGGVTRRGVVNFNFFAAPISSALPNNYRRVELSTFNNPTELTLGRNVFLNLNTFGGTGTYTYSIISGALPPGLSLLTDANLPSFADSTTAIVAGAATVSGTYPVRLRVDDTAGNFGVRDLNLVVTPLRLAPTNVPRTFGTATPVGMVNTPFSFTYGQLGGTPPYSFALYPVNTYLSPGITLSASGVLAGTTTEPGSMSVAVRVTDAAGRSRTFTDGPGIVPAGVPLFLRTSGGVGTVLPGGTVGDSYSYPLDDLLLPLSGQLPVNWTVTAGSLPPGLVIVPGGGVSATLSGTPTAGGVYFVTLLGTDAQGTRVRLTNAEITVGALGLSPAPTTLPAATQGSFYSRAFTAFGGIAPYTISAGALSDLPPGLTLVNGVLSGTPTIAGPYLLRLDVRDSASGRSEGLRYVLNVAPAGTATPNLTVTPANISVIYAQGNPAPAPIPLTTGSTGAAIAFTANASGGAWLSVAPGSGSTPNAVNLTFNVAALVPGNYSGAVTFTSGGAGNSPFVIPVSLTVSAGTPCSYSLPSTSGTVATGGGTGSVTLNTTGACSWSANSNQAWLTITAPAGGSGTGSGSIGFAAIANPSAVSRTATILAGGLTYTVTQFGTACNFSLSSNAASLPAAAGAGSVGLTTSANGCPWTALVSDPAMLSVSPASGNTSSTLNLSVTANASAASRTGTVSVGGQVFTVTQAGVSCTFSLSGAGATASSAGGALAPVNLTTAAGCAWSAVAGPAWVAVTSVVTGTGSSPVSLAVDANSSTSARSGNVIIGGQPYSVTQAGVPCSFTLFSSNPVQPSAGGSGTVDIASTGTGCNWSVASNAVWLSPVTTSGSGAATVAFHVAANPAINGRSATLSIAGQNVTVSQAGTSCSYALRSPSANIPSASALTSVGVLTAAGCSWNAGSPVPWVAITGGASGAGNADVQLKVAANPTVLPRSTVLTVAGIAFPVTQDAAACTFSLASPNGALGEFGTPAGVVNYTTSVANCVHPVQSYSGWLTAVDSYAGTTGSVTYSASPNPISQPRTGTIRVGDAVFTVTQAASTCAYTPTTLGANFGRLGGPGTIPMNYAPLACAAPGSTLNAPPGMLTLNNVLGGPGTWTQNYTVGIFNSFINYVRSGQIVINNGPIFTVKQQSW